MTDEPSFGSRLKALRLQRGLSQTALAGGEISTGYLSRLESGARQPTERVIAHLARQLGVDRRAFEAPTAAGSPLAWSLTIAASCDDGDDGDEDEAVADLTAALAACPDEAPLLRWQALWLIARHRNRGADRTGERSALEELARLADSLGLPELQCRSRTQLARCLRAGGEVARALELAVEAHRMAREAGLGVPDTGTALLALVSAEAEAGRLPEARAHAEELVALVAGRSDALRAEALWSAATVSSRQGDDEAARAYLHQALEALDSRVDPVLWARLRLAAASLYLRSRPAHTERAAACLEQAGAALSLVGTPVRQQELLVLRAQLAFEEGRYEGARAARDGLDRGQLVLTFRDRIRLETLDGLLLIAEGRPEEGRALLKSLGEEARRASSHDLAAETWRLLAETLENPS
ncbi:helix-turn-helix domain-containing protein [Streptomyces sp. WAC07149]|uniref:helix-turn-helix domain-containing protein n=1 Tax=Streptomyces sp. WAC07149 TaxID=2487425 RepID=UPI000F78576D|nr:helix-turn-helix domain-containing protein [Streptomyces sp. WAC07149]RST05618.1 helix-turn-helix domain-containing protein [Streptomyces sp. WAC07149]